MHNFVIPAAQVNKQKAAVQNAPVLMEDHRVRCTENMYKCICKVQRLLMQLSILLSILSWLMLSIHITVQYIACITALPC